MGHKKKIAMTLFRTLWAQPEVRSKVFAALASGIRVAHRHSQGLKKNAGRGAKRLRNLLRKTRPEK